MASYQYVYVMKDVTKAFPGGREVFKGITLSFLPDAKIGVLGPNGAGKSTLISLLCGQRKPSSGRVEIFGGDPRVAANRARLGMTRRRPGSPHAEGGRSAEVRRLALR